MLFKWICQWIWFVCALWTFPCLQVSSSSSCRRSSSLQVCFSYFRKFLLSVLSVMFFFCILSLFYQFPFTICLHFQFNNNSRKRNMKKNIKYKDYLSKLCVCMHVSSVETAAAAMRKKERNRLSTNLEHLHPLPWHFGMEDIYHHSRSRVNSEHISLIKMEKVSSYTRASSTDGDDLFSIWK